MPSPRESMPGAVPPNVAHRLRDLTHDLSNSLETIVQANYLVRQSTLEDEARQWVEMTDKAAESASRINRESRELLRPLR